MRNGIIQKFRHFSDGGDLGFTEVISIICCEISIFWEKVKVIRKSTNSEKRGRELLRADGGVAPNAELRQKHLATERSRASDCIQRAATDRDGAARDRTRRRSAACRSEPASRSTPACYARTTRPSSWPSVSTCCAPVAPRLPRLHALDLCRAPRPAKRIPDTVPPLSSAHCLASDLAPLFRGP